MNSTLHRSLFQLTPQDAFRSLDGARANWLADPLALSAQPGPRPLPFPPVGTSSAFTDTIGDDTIPGTNSADTFNMGDGGHDTVSGLGDKDKFKFLGAFDAGDHVDGGDGNDTLFLDGDYDVGNGVVMSATTLSNVETIDLSDGHDYRLTLDNANVTFGNTLEIDGSALTAEHHLIFDGSDETSSRLTISGGAGSDTLLGGGADDTIRPGAGNDTIDAGAGEDTIDADANFNSLDQIDGGAGRDVLILDGDYSAGFGLFVVRNVEVLQPGQRWELQPLRRRRGRGSVRRLAYRRRSSQHLSRSRRASAGRGPPQGPRRLRQRSGRNWSQRPGCHQDRRR